MFGLKSSTYFFTGMSHEPKSSSVGMVSAAQRTTATVNPLTPSSLNGPIVTNGSQSAHGTPNSRGSHTASFAAALRKLAKQAEEPRGCSRGNEHSPVSSPVTNHSSPTGTPKRAQGTIIVPPGNQRVANTPPVVTIAPTQTVNGLWRGDGRQPNFTNKMYDVDCNVRTVKTVISEALGYSGHHKAQLSDSALRSSSREHPLSTESLLKKDKLAVPTHPAPSHPAFYLASNSAQDSPYSAINLQRPVPHLVSSSSRAEDFLSSFRPYHSRNEIQALSSLASLGLDSSAAAASAGYYHPAFLSHLPFHHPTYRIDDPCVLSFRPPFFHIPQPGTMPHLQPPNMHLSRTGMRQHLDATHPSHPALHSDHLSILTGGRLPIEEEKQREKEREHEKEKDWECETLRERKREAITEQERKREKQNETEWEKEIKRRKEMKQEKVLDLDYRAEQNATAAGDAGPRRFEGWKDFISAMEPFQPIHRNNEHTKSWWSTSSPHTEQKESSLGSGKVRTLPLEPVAIPASSLLGVPPMGSSYCSPREGKCAVRHSHLQQEREDRPVHGVDFRQQHRQQQSDLIQGHQPPEQEQERNRVTPEDEKQERPMRLRAPPPLISPRHPLREHSPLPRPFPSAHALNYSTNSSRNNYEVQRDLERVQNIELRSENVKAAGEHFNRELPKTCTEKDVSVIKKSGLASLKCGTVPPLKGQASSRQPVRDADSDFKHPIVDSRREELQRECLDLSATSGVADLSLKKKERSLPPTRPVPCSSDALVIGLGSEDPPLDKPVVSKLDMAERKLKEARMNGQHFGLISSDVGVCKEAIRRKMHRLIERAPLKLDDTPRKLHFLGAVGLTTQSRKEEVKQQKLRKRRRMLREHSPSRLHSENKRAAPFCVLSLSHSPGELNKAADLEEKKEFLALFNLKHLIPLQTKDASGLTGAPNVSCLSVLAPDSSQTVHPHEKLPARPRAEQRLTPPALESMSNDRTSGVNENKSDKLGTADFSGASSDKCKPYGMVTDRKRKLKPPHQFTGNFQESVLQSAETQPSHHHPVGEAENDRCCSSMAPRLSLCGSHAKQQRQQATEDLQHQDQSRRNIPQVEESESEDEINWQPKWQGVTAVLEAYQEYLEEKNLEQQLLEEQLSHLKNRNQELNITAENLRVHMLELKLCKQRFEVERQRHQAALNNLRKCLDLTHCWPTSSYR